MNEFILPKQQINRREEEIYQGTYVAAEMRQYSLEKADFCILVLGCLKGYNYNICI